MGSQGCSSIQFPDVALGVFSGPLVSPTVASHHSSHYFFFSIKTNVLVSIRTAMNQMKDIFDETNQDNWEESIARVVEIQNVVDDWVDAIARTHCVRPEENTHLGTLSGAKASALCKI